MILSHSRGRLCYTILLRLRATQIFEQGVLLAGDEAQLQPAEDVVHDGFGDGDVLVAGEAAGLEAGVRELVAEQF